MEYLNDILADVEERIDHISAIGDVNEDLVKIARVNLESIKADLTATGKNAGILNKVNTQLRMYDQVAMIPALATKFPIIREQMIVLMIGALEVFIADVYKEIANRNAEYFYWNDTKEKITFEPSILREGFTLGDVLTGHLKNKGYSFQDLHSLIRSFEVYCGIQIELDTKSKDMMILGAAARHIIVHNRSEVDSQFLKQIRETIYAKRYKKGKPINVTDDFVAELRDVIKTFCGYIIVHLQQRDD